MNRRKKKKIIQKYALESLIIKMVAAILRRRYERTYTLRNYVFIIEEALLMQVSRNYNRHIHGHRPFNRVGTNLIYIYFNRPCSLAELDAGFYDFRINTYKVTRNDTHRIYSQFLKGLKYAAEYSAYYQCKDVKSLIPLNTMPKIIAFEREEPFKIKDLPCEDIKSSIRNMVNLYTTTTKDEVKRILGRSSDEG